MKELRIFLFVDCAPDGSFDSSVGNYLGIVTRYMDNIYLSDTSHYIDCLVSLCKSASKSKFWNFFLLTVIFSS